MDSQSIRDFWRGRVTEALADAVPAREPRELYTPARYVLEGGGKRVRPILTLLAAEIYGGRGEDAVPAAVAVEVFHNFTLVHDDIMDHADTRRGRPTVHARWDEATAILVGDLLMGLAYKHLGRLAPGVIPEAINTFSRMVASLCEGQALDMAFEQRGDVSMGQYLSMIDRKTGALLACALELGAIVAEAPAEEREPLREAGLEIGRAFQIQDDLLDLIASGDRWGKTVGGDLLEGKRTYLTVLAKSRFEGTDADLLARVFEGNLPRDEVDQVRDAMKRTGVLNDSRDAVIFHTNAGIQHLEAAPFSPARTALVDLVRGMQRRLH